jgi:mono/diheme cytochrome c family protein
LEAENLMIQHGVKATHEETADIEDLAIKAGIVYEAKANPVIYNYVDSKGFQAKSTRAAAAAQTVNKINNKPYDQNNTFELPSGSIEIKATWRRYDASLDNLDDYIHQQGLYYTGSDNKYTAHNATMLLIGLHIIHKTPSFPEFTFATFEHKSNEKNGFIYKNTNPQTVTAAGVTRKLPDPGTIEAKRQYPIPGAGSAFDLQAFNASVQQQMQASFGQNIFLANYELIGIQATVADNPSAAVPAQEFFLSNFATETNNALQFFQGGLTGTFANVPDPNIKSVHSYNSSSQQYEAHASGGCLGCHGSQGQKGGYDFSVISANGNFFAPEAIEPYPGGLIVPQNPTGFPLSQTPSQNTTNSNNNQQP